MLFSKMSIMTKVKICGLTEPNSLTAAIEAGADFVGLVFYAPSPRHVEVEVAKYLASFIPDNVGIVGLFVNPEDDYLTQVLQDVPLTMIQLHGDETPARVTEIKEKFKLPVMKAIPIANADDLKNAALYEAVADWLLFDAKGEALPGGNGKAFDWAILKEYQGTKPWMLAGGVTPDNIEDALKITTPDALDVSSGVESAKGVKDSDKIRSFIFAVKQA